MYLEIKNSITKIVPRKLLFQQEETLRKLFSIFYSGTTYQCSVCNKNLNRFITTIHHDRLCPNCGSLERNRRLWLLLEREFLVPNSTILDFSPSRCLYRKLKKIKDINYQSTDLSGDFIADFQYDITDIKIEDNIFDLVICYHILEHIPNDLQAIKELYRILKPGAKALVQTPFKDGAIYENNSIVSKKDRLEHFGQEDHVRIYSVAGLKQRLENCGFLVEVIQNFNDNPKFGLNKDEIILIITKPSNL
jgi:SAM-dependent methyltransferase